MGKPAFNPNQAYEPVSKPAFDASKPFEPLSKPNPTLGNIPPNALEDLGKKAVGFSVGVADAMNPAQLPHFAETVLRTMSPVRGRAIPEGQSAWQTIKNDWEDAKKHTLLPEGNVDQIAAVARTAADLVPDIAKAPFEGLPSIDKIKQTYEREKAAQESFNKEFIPKGSREAGEVTAGVVNLGLLAKDIVNVGGALTKGLSNAAEMQAYKATKPIAKDAQIIARADREKAIGRQLLDDGIVGKVPVSYEKMLERTEKKLQEHGEAIGHFSKQADNAIARDSSIRGVMVEDINSQIANRLIPKLQEEGAADVAASVQNWALTNLKAAAPSGEIGFQQLQKIKGTLGKTKAKFKASVDNISADAFQEVYGIINDAQEAGIGNALTKGGSKDSIAQFNKAKDSYRNLKDTQTFLEKAKASQSTNLKYGLTDVISGAGGGVAGTILGGVPGGILGLGAGIGHKFLRTKGNQVGANLFETLKNLNETPFLQGPSQFIRRGP